MRRLKSGVFAFLALAMVSSSALAAGEVAGSSSSLSSSTLSVGQSFGPGVGSSMNKKNRRWAGFVISFIDLIIISIGSYIIIHNGHHHTPNSP